VIVDAHAHVWKAVASTADTVVPSTADIPLSLLKTYLAEHGVDRAVLVQPMYPGEDNSMVVDAARAEPGRFAAVVVARTPEGLERWAKRGARGLRVRPSFPGEDCGSDALWEAARGLGLVISVLARPPQLADVARMAARFPGVPVVVDHYGHCDGAALFDLARHPNVHVKTSGLYHFKPADAAALFRAVHARFGPDRLLWGSDFPHVLLKTGYAAALRGPELDRDRVLGGTARRLYWGD
jgi:predicted TIM-barrel fold metal-dependent hydrolase